MKSLRLLFCAFCCAVVSTLSYATNIESPTCAQWETVELSFKLLPEASNPYLLNAGYVLFTHDCGKQIKRPLFWDGNDIFKVRFSSPFGEGNWDWVLHLETGISCIGAGKGRFISTAAKGESVFSKHGFWNIPKNSRQIQYADGRKVVMVADTAWALPWRATLEEAEVYAKNRQKRGFNAALLMTIQPDKRAEGPRNRLHEQGFAVAFEDLPTGHINELNPDYFQYLDQLIEILRLHEIVPVFQPVFHGYGWKGLDTAGNALDGDEYARFCKYLVARYGAGPAMWLVGGDGIGDAPSLEPAGEMIEAWDDYRHPTGIHYAPHGKTDSHQSADWLDFQWAQTGHNGEHLPEVALELYHQRPVKASTNGEPTYEHIGTFGKAQGWWQGHEAWSNLCSGGVMGVVYGAGSLWNWVRNAEENDAQSWSFAPGKSWRDAIDFEGSSYVGNLGKILNAFDVSGVKPDWSIAPSRRGLWVPGEFLVVYLGNGGGVWFPDWEVLPPLYRVYNPKTSELEYEGSLKIGGDNPGLNGDSPEPRVIVFYTGERLLEG